MYKRQAHHIEAAGAGLILPEPFSQEALDTALAQMFDSGFRDQCRAGGLAYAASEDLYSLHSTGASLIEQLLLRRQGRGDG